MTRRSSTRGTPPGLLGKSGSITRHSKSVRSYRLMPVLNEIDAALGIPFMSSRPSQTTSSRIGQLLIGMRWTTLSFADLDCSLLIGDEPIVVTNGMTQAYSLFMLPIGAKRIFLATHSVRQIERIHSIGRKRLCALMNDRVCRQSRDIIIAQDSMHDSFVDRRFSRASCQAPEDTILCNSWFQPLEAMPSYTPMWKRELQARNTSIKASA